MQKSTNPLKSLSSLCIKDKPAFSPLSIEKDIRLFYDVDSYIEANVLGEIDNEHIGEYLNEKMQDKMFDHYKFLWV